jgi:hypothetical protein
MMKKRLANKPEIADFLIPSFAVGCRRLTPGPGYLEALIEDNVEFVSTKINSIMPKGVELENGRIVELDALSMCNRLQRSRTAAIRGHGKEWCKLRRAIQAFSRNVPVD